MENIIEDEFGEFDIQTTVLKKRTVDLKQSVYVEYDKLNYSVVAISPINITPSVTRNKVQVVDQTDLTNKVFSNKISLSKLIVKKDSKTNKVELQYIKPTFKSEFDYIFALASNQSYIYLNCDLISKKRTAKYVFPSFLNSSIDSTIFNVLLLIPDIFRCKFILSIFSDIEGILNCVPILFALA